MGQTIQSGAVKKLMATEPSEFVDLGDVFIRASAIISCIWDNPEAGTLPGDQAPWQLRVTLINGDRVWLSGAAAQVVLRALKIKSKNPYPKGKK